MKFVAFIQARMSSSRLPGKVLATIKGKAVLQYIIERLEQCRQLDGIVVLTSQDTSDDPVEAFCRSHGIEYFRGKLRNVAARFLAATDIYPARYFIRICGDSPLIDSSLIELGIRLMDEYQCDLVTNCRPKTYPAGQSVEILNTRVYRNTYSKFSEPGDFEHVTHYFKRYKEAFTIKEFTAEKDFSNIRMTVDALEDFEIIQKLILRLEKDHREYGYRELIAMLRVSN